ncbi:ice-binding family protein [Candidatus Kuenenia stuttgartiensis]|nr:ice-binding family protein [Candidatus Kuenenia stuttgartiensis]
MFYRCLFLSFSLALFSLAQTATAQTLGDAESFAVLGGSAVTFAGTGSNITGDVGVSPGTVITGHPANVTIVPPYTIHVNDGAAVAAQTAVTALYIELDTTGGATVIGPQLSGETVGQGIYAFSAEADLAANGLFTLDGAGIYIFQVGSALTANVGSNVSLINGATACNVFWQVTSAATLNGDTFAGTVVAQAAVTLGVDAVLDGRALTTSLGAVTMTGGNTVNILCEGIPTPSPAPTGEGTPTPTPGPTGEGTPTPTPTPGPTGEGTPTPTPTPGPTGEGTPTPNPTPGPTGEGTPTPTPVASLSPIPSPTESPTAVSLISFKAKVNGDGSVILKWETASEIDNAGFNVYRSKRKDGRYRKINRKLIPAQGSGSFGASYSYEDTLQKKGNFYYKLEDVDTYGESTMHGPVKVRFRIGEGAAGSSR